MKYELYQKHDESVIARRVFIEENHPAYKEYRESITTAWDKYQEALEIAFNTREQKIPQEVMAKMIKGEVKCTW